MADIFTRSNVQNLLKNKKVWFFGDSNMRGIYKDLIWLLEKNTLINLNSLRGKLESSFLNDVLVRGGALHRGRNFQENRIYKNLKVGTSIEFTFLTQCCSNDIKERLKDASNGKDIPNVVVINSCLWDVTRWGPESVTKYKANIINLLQALKSLPPDVRVIWITTPPISNEPRGGFFIKQIEFLKHTLRFDVMEANAFASREFILQGFDVLDIHYHLLMQIHRRQPDGIHWSPEAMRHITNLLLTHICISWDLPLPGNFKSPLLDKLQAKCSSGTTETKESVKTVVKTLNNLVTIPQESENEKLKGKKRSCNDNFICQEYSDWDFTEDVFNYDYERKRFKME